MNQLLRFALLCCLSVVNLPLHGQDTFSIVAVDESTGEIGSAGASCVVGAASFGGVILISGIIPGRGAINGQATICIPHTNLNIGISQMTLGATPQEILDYLYSNDGCIFGSNESRQYGVVDFDSAGVARSAAFTGNDALSYAGHRIGPNYAIQGNILLGPEILDSMEARFLNTEGPLAKKLMAAMQGANVPGADSRCLDDGTSSTSAFLRVAQPDDAFSDLYLDINIIEEPTGVEPINSLQTAFDAWCDTTLVNDVSDIVTQSKVSIYPNPVKDALNIFISDQLKGDLQATFYNISGQKIFESSIVAGINQVLVPDNILSQMLIVKINDQNGDLVYSDKIQLLRE